MSDTKTVVDAVREYLLSHKLDGLCNDECGCSVEDLAPCGSINGDCAIASKIENPDCNNCESKCSPYPDNSKVETCYKPVLFGAITLNKQK